MAVQVLKDKCKGCTKCVKSCPFEAITMEGKLAVIGTACTGCGQCIKVCPQNAICRSDPHITDSSLCISCGACISVCPTGARNYHQDAYPAAKAAFEAKCAAYRTPETFYIA